MVYPFNFLQWELHVLPALAILVFLLPYSSNNKIRYYGCSILYIFATSVAAIIFLPVFLIRFKNVKNCVIAGYVLRNISKIVGIKWELRRGEILQEERGAVIVANHQSMFDVLGMLSFWDIMGKCAAIARKEVFYVWPFGLSAWLAGVVFIDRVNGRVGNKQLIETSELMNKKKTKLWLFPEGTRNKKPDTLLPFKRGAFRVAIISQVPIIPVVFSPYYFVDSEKKIFGRGRITVTVLDPIPTKGLTESDIDSLLEKTRDLMVKQYEISKQEVMSFEDTKKIKS